MRTQYDRRENGGAYLLGREGVAKHVAELAAIVIIQQRQQWITPLDQTEFVLTLISLEHLLRSPIVLM